MDQQLRTILPFLSVPVTGYYSAGRLQRWLQVCHELGMGEDTPLHGQELPLADHGWCRHHCVKHRLSLWQVERNKHLALVKHTHSIDYLDLFCSLGFLLWVSRIVATTDMMRGLATGSAQVFNYMEALKLSHSLVRPTHIPRKPDTWPFNEKNVLSHVWDLFSKSKTEGLVFCLCPSGTWGQWPLPSGSRNDWAWACCLNSETLKQQ